MAYFYRLALLFICFSAYISSSLAGTFPVPRSGWSLSGSAPYYEKPDYAAQAYRAANYPNDSPLIWTAQSTTYPYKILKSGAVWANLYYAASTCPSGTTGPTGSEPNLICTDTCVSPQTFDLYTGSCQSPNTCNSGTQMTGEYFIPARSDITVANATKSDISTLTCTNGCETKLDAGGVQWYIATNGANKYISGNLVQTGNRCKTGAQASSVSSSTQAEQDCKAQGKGFVTIGGVTTCVANGTSGASNPISVTTKTTSSSSSSSTSTSVTNVTTNNVVNNDGTITSTTITNNPDGTQSTSTKTQDKKSFCEENPTLNLCKTSSISTSCGAFSCDGDAIQCAIARKIYQNRCDDLKDIDDAKTEIQGKAAYTTGQKLMNNDYDQDVKDWLNKSGDNSRTVDIPSSLSESGGASFSGDAIQDYHGNVMGQAFTVPFSSANTDFNYFGYILLGLTYLACYKYIASVV